MSTDGDSGTSNITTATAVVHLDYDLANPPPVPSPEWTRFVCISDTHTRTFHVPPGDVLLHSGDLTNTGLFSEFRTTVEWLRELPHATKMSVNIASYLPQTDDDRYDADSLQGIMISVSTSTTIGTTSTTSGGTTRRRSVPLNCLSLFSFRDKNVLL